MFQPDDNSNKYGNFFANLYVVIQHYYVSIVLTAIQSLIDHGCLTYNICQLINKIKKEIHDNKIFRIKKINSNLDIWKWNCNEFDQSAIDAFDNDAAGIELLEPVE